MSERKQKLNILFIASYYYPYEIGGAERMLKIHMEGLKKNGHNVSLLTLGPKAVNVKQSEINNICVYRAPIKNVYWPKDPIKQNKIKKVIWHLIDIYNSRHNKDIDTIISKEKPNIIICENIAGWSPAIWKHIATKKHIPIIQITHDCAFLCTFGIMYRDGKRCIQPCLKCRFLTNSYRNNAKYVKEFVFVSKSQFDTFQRAKFPMSSSNIIYNAEPIKLEEKKNIWSGNRAMRLGLLATLSEAKGVLKLIKAFKLLKGDFKLYLGGNPISEVMHQQILDEIGTDKRITLCGYINSSKFFKFIDLTIAPSLAAESFGLIAIESCAKQVPVIASNFGGLSEIIKDGINGVHCNPTDVKSIANSIQKLYDKPSLYKQLCYNTIDSVRDFSSTNKMITNIEQLCYKNIK